MIKILNPFCMQNLSQISGPVCPQLFGLASFLWTIAFDKAEPTLDQPHFIMVRKKTHLRNSNIMLFPMPTSKSFLWKIID